MSCQSFFIVDYQFFGKPKSFILRVATMSNPVAWHWASCDAGVAPIPKPCKAPVKMFSKPMAERHGVTDVKWRESTSLNWTEVSSS